MVFHGDVILAANLGIFYNFAGMKREELEIMAPVGSLSSLSAAARAGAERTAALDHEVRDYPVEDQAVVIAFFGQRDKIIYRIRRHIWA